MMRLIYPWVCVEAGIDHDPVDEVIDHCGDAIANKAAAAKIGSSLIGRKLIREIRSKPGMPVWREDEHGRSVSLVITRAGRDAIGINEVDETCLPISSKSSVAKLASRHLPSAAPRAGSKQALVIEMLLQAAGHDARRFGGSDRLASAYDVRP